MLRAPRRAAEYEMDLIPYNYELLRLEQAEDWEKVEATKVLEILG